MHRDRIGGRMGVGKLLITSPIAEAEEGVRVNFVIKIDNTDWNPINTELYRITMHDDSPQSPERCWWYGAEGLCSREEDVNNCYIWEGWVNALIDEHITSYFIMPNFDVKLRFGLWRKSGDTWVKDDEAVLSVGLKRQGPDIVTAVLLIAGIGAGAYLLSQVVKLIKR